MVTALPPEVTARVVVVAVACAEARFHAPHRVAARTTSVAARLLRLREEFSAGREEEV
jgi:hypothetical protein